MKMCKYLAMPCIPKISFSGPCNSTKPIAGLCTCDDTILAPSLHQFDPTSWKPSTRHLQRLSHSPMRSTISRRTSCGNYDELMLHLVNCELQGFKCPPNSSTMPGFEEWRRNTIARTVDLVQMRGVFLSCQGFQTKN